MPVVSTVVPFGGDGWETAVDPSVGRLDLGSQASPVKILSLCRSRFEGKKKTGPIIMRTAKGIGG